MLCWWNLGNAGLVGAVPRLGIEDYHHGGGGGAPGRVPPPGGGGARRCALCGGPGHEVAQCPAARAP